MYYVTDEVTLKQEGKGKLDVWVIFTYCLK